MSAQPSPSPAPVPPPSTVPGRSQSDVSGASGALLAQSRRQRAAGWSLEDLELVLQPMAEDGKEPIGSMGDHSPLAVLSERYRGLHHFFRQNFSQVTNPPIDSLRERQVMTIRTRLGNLGNILDESPEQSEMLSLQSPIVLNAEFEAMRKYMGDTAARIDCTFEVEGGLDAMRQAFDRICQEAEDAVRSGCLHLVLTDANVDGDRAALPMIARKPGSRSKALARTCVAPVGGGVSSVLSPKLASKPNAPAAAITMASGNTKCPVVWSLCGSVSMTRRTGFVVSFFTVSMMARDATGFCPVSITTTPSSVRMMPLLESKPLPVWT